LPSKPPWALISSAARMWPFNDGSPSTAAGPVRKVMCPVLYGVSGILPLGGSAAALTSCGPATRPAPARPVPPTVTPSAPRNLRRSTAVGLSMGISSERLLWGGGRDGDRLRWASCITQACHARRVRGSHFRLRLGRHVREAIGRRVGRSIGRHAGSEWHRGDLP